MNKVTLSSIIHIISGGTPKTFVSEYWDNGHIGWLSVGDFNTGKRYVYDSEKKITTKGLNESGTKLLEREDIIISARGTVGVLAQIGTPMCFNQSCFGIRGKKDKVRNDFLYYALKNYVENIKKVGHGSVFNTINLASFDLMEIEIPEYLEIQKKIASVLSFLDEKIELNNRINTQLEAMAKTLYDYWFVQFDFPNQDGKPYKSSGGEMVYNEVLKREIPEGWNVSALTAFVGLDKSGDWGKEESQGNYTQKVLCIRGADINGINGKGEVNCPTRFILEKNENKILKPFDIVIEISGGSPTQSTGRMAFITERTIKRFNEQLICSNFCKAISLKDNSYFYYFVYLWNSIYDENILFGWEGKTSGIKNLLFDAFVTNHHAVVPKASIAKSFFDLIAKIQDKKQQNLAENQQLTQLRDWLLPMLMNGQVKVS